jgi:hypothetical protein
MGLDVAAQKKSTWLASHAKYQSARTNNYVGVHVV